jgi:hypothetical protein
MPASSTSTSSVCASCVHYRLQEPPDPFAGIRLASSKMLELRNKWQQELATQASLEEQRYLTGQTFDFEPIAFPWCRHHSERSSAALDPVSGRRHTAYVLCVQQNPEGGCSDFAVPERAERDG